MKRWVLLSVLLCATPAAAQDGRMPAAASRLDALFAAGDYAALDRAFTAITDSELLLLANWQEQKIGAGANAWLALAYSRTMARAARTFTGGVTDFAEAGATFLVYAYAAVAVDGLACADPAKPAGFAERIAREEGLWRYVAEMSPDHAGFLIDSALQTEIAMAPARGQDTHLCGGALRTAMPEAQAAARRALPEKIAAIVAGARSARKPR